MLEVELPGMEQTGLPRLSDVDNKSYISNE